MAVCRKLQQRGYEAVVVGGGVRDSLLGRNPSDWDVATSALPNEVQGVFNRVIPTGIEHGTVTVVMGKVSIEVTSFRGDGEYQDGRRPDSVTLGVPLHEDLARRDFTMNAIAYDPLNGQIVDPFGGQADIAGHVVKAVGDPWRRFDEDGLRVFRALRFASVLGFEIDEGTLNALSGAQEKARNVARERVFVEFKKWLSGKSPSWRWKLGERGKVNHLWFKERLPLVRPDELDRGSRWVTRASVLVEDYSASEVKDWALWMKWSGAEQKLLRSLCDFSREANGDVSSVNVRKWVSRWGPQYLHEFIDRTSGRPELHNELLALKDSDPPLSLKDLAVSGEDLVAMGLSGKTIGDVLQALLNCVLEDPQKNRREILLRRAEELHSHR